MSAGKPLWYLGMSVLLGVGLPWISVRMLAPSLEAGRSVSNYRGRRVHSGLGVAWLVWSLGAVAADRFGGGEIPLLLWAGLLALTSFAFGLFDDAYGSGESRGFRGHLGAMIAGRLTTGGLKLFGISAASYAAALAITSVSPWGAEASGRSAWVLAVPAGAAIALTSNLVNLSDLRPGRALKLYSLLAALGVAALAGGFVARPAAYELAAVAFFLAGPVIATWGPDLGERGMAGDSGANAAGAVAGMFIVSSLPLVLMLAYLAVVLVLNVMSEKMSFSSVIEGNTVLRWLDMIGRAEKSGAQPTGRAIESVRQDETIEER